MGITYLIWEILERLGFLLYHHIMYLGYLIQIYYSRQFSHHIGSM